MKVRALIVGLVMTSAGLVLASAGCNAILGNEEGWKRIAPLAPAEAGAPDTGRPTPDPDAGIKPLETCDTAQGKKLCFGLCVSIDAPATGCGQSSCVACDLDNVAKAKCEVAAESGFVCGIETCRSGFDNCDGVRTNGCEASLSRPVTCGNCGQNCTVTIKPLCAGGTCVDSCPVEAPTNCSGACVDTATSVEHCGQCGNFCDKANATALCVNSQCAFTCINGTHLCSGACVQNDPMACGSSCALCNVYKHTIATCELNTFGADYECGSKCENGWLDCDNDPSTGCETSTANSTGTCPRSALCEPECKPDSEQCCNGVCIDIGTLCAIGPPSGP